MPQQCIHKTAPSGTPRATLFKPVTTDFIKLAPSVGKKYCLIMAETLYLGGGLRNMKQRCHSKSTVDRGRSQMGNSYKS